jgi:hypothetical protein
MSFVREQIDVQQVRVMLVTMNDWSVNSGIVMIFPSDPVKFSSISEKGFWLALD